MKLKWIMLIGFGVFLVVVFLAIGVSAKFNFSVVMDKPYEFIEGFFQQWSPTLSAAGSIIAALVALTAILEVRRERRLTILDQQLLRVEEWARDISETMFRLKAIFDFSEQESTHEKLLEDTATSLGKELEELEAVKREDPKITLIRQKLLGAWVTTRQQDSYLGCRLIFLSAWLWAILGTSVAQIGVTNDLHRV